MKKDPSIKMAIQRRMGALMARLQDRKRVLESHNMPGFIRIQQGLEELDRAFQRVQDPKDKTTHEDLDKLVSIWEEYEAEKLKPLGAQPDELSWQDYGEELHAVLDRMTILAVRTQLLTGKKDKVAVDIMKKCIELEEKHKKPASALRELGELKKRLVKHLEGK